MRQAERARGALKQARFIALGPDRPERRAVLLAFGQNLRSLRAAAGLSQEQLARRCFLRSDDVSGLERGVRAPTLTVLLMLAQAMGVSVGELTDGLIAPSRQAARTQVLALIASHSGIATDTLAEQLGLPAWYVGQLVRCLESTGEIVSESVGWRVASGETPSAG